MGGGIFIPLWVLGLGVVIPPVYYPGEWPRADVPARALRFDVPARQLWYEVPVRRLEFTVPKDGVRVP